MTTTLADVHIKLEVDIGASSICLFYGRDIYDAAVDQILSTFPTTIANQILGSLYQIGSGWTAARSSDFGSVVKHSELNHYLILDDGGEITFGRDVPQMQNSFNLLKELGDNATSIVMIFRVVGFGKDDPHGSILNPASHLNMRETVTALTGSGIISILGNTQYVPTHIGTNADVP
jgi:hypothetical protein